MKDQSVETIIFRKLIFNRKKYKQASNFYLIYWLSKYDLFKVQK